MNINSNKQL